MKGFLEELSGRTFIVRSGEHRLKWDDPYDYAVIFNVPPGSDTGEFKACVTKPPTLEAIREAVRILNAAGFKVKWQRLTKAHQYSIEQQHSSNGDIRMAKKAKIHDISIIFNADGTLNEGKGMSGMNHALHQIHGGHYQIVNGKATQTPVADVPGAVDFSITFRRIETDPKAPAEPAPTV